MGQIIAWPQNGDVSKISVAKPVPTKVTVSVGEVLNTPPERRLKNVLQTHGYYEQAHQIFALRPNLLSACAKLSDYTTEWFPGEDSTPLLIQTIGRAIERFTLLAMRANDERIPEAAFLRELSLAAPSLLLWHVSGVDARGARHYWAPMDTPVGQWMRRKKIVQIEFNRYQHAPSAADGQAATKFLLHRIMAWTDIYSMGLIEGAKA